MANKEERISKPLSFDVIIEKRKEDPEMLQNDFDDDIFLTKKKSKTTCNPKQNIIFFIILLLVIIIFGLIIFIIIYLNTNINEKNKNSCDIGEEEKCKTCKEDINECLTCNPGYFIPDDEDKIKYECQKCPVANCSFCNGTRLSNTCHSCKYYLEPLIRNDKIVSCDYTCVTGEKEKCATCSKENICSSCNDDYALLEGKCLLEYSFSATYYTETDNQTIKLIGHPDIHKIVKMKIGEKVLMNPPSNYAFPSAGNHTVDILIDLSQIASFANFFAQFNFHLFLSIFL